MFRTRVVSHSMVCATHVGSGEPSQASPRTELLHNINGACHKGYVHPNAAVRVGEMKLLVDCFDYATMRPSGLVELYGVCA